MMELYMAVETVEFKKSPPVMTTERTSEREGMNPQTVAQDAILAPTATKADGGAAAGANSQAMALPDKGKSEELNAKPVDVEKDAAKSLIARALAALGLTQEEKDHAENDLKGKATGNGGKAPVPQDAVAAAERVSGNNFGNIDPAVLAAATKGLRDSGTKIENADHTPPQVQTASVAKQQETSAAIG